MKLIATSSLRAKIDRECRSTLPHLVMTMELERAVNQIRRSLDGIRIPAEVSASWKMRHRNDAKELSPGQLMTGVLVEGMLNGVASTRVNPQISIEAAKSCHIVPIEELSVPVFSRAYQTAVERIEGPEKRFSSEELAEYVATLHRGCRPCCQ